MRNVLVVVLVAGLSLVVPRSSAAQDPERQGAGAGSGSGSGSASSGGGGTSTYTVTTQEKPAAKPQIIEPPRFGRWVSALTNVQIELTITDQTGAEKPEKKMVSMIVSSGNWGKIRSAGSVRPIGDAPYGVDLGVDARPFVSVDGPIQVELTLNYAPPPSAENAKGRPTGVNQSLTVVLQSGKPLVVSQAADPLNDRKIVVEVKATVLK